MLHTPEDFLSAIEAAPADRTRRLVFADWLDEHDDFRGELIRVEEEMREVPVFSDRFWELKPRRNALRVQAGQEWCGRMRYGTECEPVFRHGIPDGWRERWRLIREFTERWHRIPMPDVGGRQAEIAEAEGKLASGSYFGSLFRFRQSEPRRKLPSSVREWVAFSHDVRQIPDLRAANEGEAIPGHAAMSLWRTRNSAIDDRLGDSLDGVRFADFTQEDPPVYVYWESVTADYDSALAQSTTPCSNTVSAFALDHVFARTRGDGGEFITLVEQPGGLLHELKLAFACGVQFGEKEWYQADNVFIRLEPWPGDSSNGSFLSVRVAKSISPERIPNFLWDYARLASNPSGMFARQ